MKYLGSMKYGVEILVILWFEVVFTLSRSG